MCPLGRHLEPFVRQVQLPISPPTSHCTHTDMAFFASSHQPRSSCSPAPGVPSAHQGPGLLALLHLCDPWHLSRLASPHLTSPQGCLRNYLLQTFISPSAGMSMCFSHGTCLGLWINIPQQPESTRSRNAGTIKVEHRPLEPMDQSRESNSGLQENWPL